MGKAICHKRLSSRTFITIVFDSPFELYGEVAYRATSDVETDNSLFPGSLDIENKQTTFSVGFRYSFGR